MEVEFPEDGWLSAADEPVRPFFLSMSFSMVLTRYKLSMQSLAKLLPPKKADLDPRPAVVDEAPFEEADPTDVCTSFWSSDYLLIRLPQFGDGGEEAWVDEDDDYDDEDGDPDCRTQ
jgi:hypothetical protein